MRRVLLAALAASALLLAGAAAAGPDAGSKLYRFSFEAYANNVRVVAPLVGKWQLGQARIRGSGYFGDGRLGGTVYDTDDPRLPQYAPRWLRAKVVGYAFRMLPHGGPTKLSLTVEIVSSSHEDEECARGLRGTLELVDHEARLSNGETADSVKLWKWKGRCNTHVHGWNNTDPGPRTDPPTGGPGGGNWADVRVKVS